MSNIQAVTPPSPQSQPHDALLELVRVEIPTELKRMKRQEPSTANIHAELHGTVGSFVKSLGDYMVEIRDWVNEMHLIHADHLEALEARIDGVEDYGTETQILPADADILLKVVIACKLLASELAAGPVSERDDEGKRKLAEIIALCDQSEKIVQENVFYGDDGDDGDDDGGAEEGAESD
jgi:hypothetical protein